MTRTVLAAAMLASLQSSVYAQAQPYPSKPIRLIVPNAPGGGSDLVARVVAERLSRSLGRQAIVENREGAAGQVGAELVAKSAPDGYTLLVGTSLTLITAPALNPKITYKSPEDFAPISLLGTTTYVLVIHPSVPAKSVKDLVSLAKARPGAFNYASAGVGSPGHLSGELFQSLTGTKMLQVPYKGSAPAILSVSTGETDLTFGNLLPVRPFVAAQRLRPLAVASLTRSSLLPDLPTLDESGLKGFDVRQFYALLAPARTSREIVNRLGSELERVMQSPETRQALAKDGTEVVTSSPEELEKLIVREISKWSRVIRSAQIARE
jgi:tripartite-type tricarboxylate transporter receptor subunit TctC